MTTLEAKILRRALIESQGFAWHKIDCEYLKPFHATVCTCGYSQWRERIQRLVKGET